MVNREVDSKSPRSPLSHSRSLAAIPPDTAKPTPPVSPAGFLVFGQLPATVLGSYHPSFRGGGSGLGGLAAEPSP